MRSTGEEAGHKGARGGTRGKARISDAFTAKQRRFIAEYLVDGNATQAAIRAGYSRKTANEQGARLLAKVSIAAAVAAGQQRVQAKLEVTAEDIARELARCGFANMADYFHQDNDGDPRLDWSKLTREQAAALQEVTVDRYVEGHGDEAQPVKRVKFRLVDKRAALVDLAKLLGFWKEKHEHDVGGTLEDLIKASYAPAPR